MKTKRLLMTAIVLGMLACSETDDPTPNTNNNNGGDPDPEITISNPTVNLTVAENPSNGHVLATINASGVDGISFELTSESVTGAFAIGSSSGELSVADETQFDFEINTELTCVITASSGALTATASVTVTLTDEADAMISITAFEITIDENPTADQVLGTVQASTDQGTLTFSIQSESVTGAFAIDATSGELSVGDIAAFDYETNQTVTAVIEVSNGTQSQTGDVSVTLNDVANEPVPFDADDDGLIDIHNIDQLDAMRYDLDANGVADDSSNDNKYAAAFPSATSGTYTGYELMSDLDFNNVNDYVNVSLQASYASGAGWIPVGSSSSAAFNAIFEGNGNIIDHLFINRSGSIRQGLFGATSSTAEIRSLGLANINIVAKFASGGIVGENHCAITKCFVTGEISGTQGRIGGMVGSNDANISESYTDVNVSGTADLVGGLVGLDSNQGQSITNCYATGSVEGANPAGGLISGNSSILSNSYSTGTVTSNGSQVGGLTGAEWNTTSDSYWDTTTSGHATSASGSGKTTSELQGPTSNSGIYANWDSSVWDFGTSSQYPVLKNVAGGVDMQR